MNLETVEQIVSIVVGGGLVSTGCTFLWTWRSDRLEQYRHLDAAYGELLGAYRDHPQLGDPAATVQYATALTGDARLKYHYFAMSVHNMLETMFDVLRQNPASRRVWASIFKHHARLHYAWLLDNGDAFEPEYITYVKQLLGERPRATSTFPQITDVAPLAPVTRTGVDVPRPTDPL